MSQKVVVTGLGAFSPIGGTVSETWDNALQGVSGVTTLTDDWVAEYDLPVYIAGRAGQSVEDSEFISKVETKRLDPSGQFAVIAAREAWKDAGFTADDADAAEEHERDERACTARASAPRAHATNSKKSTHRTRRTRSRSTWRPCTR